MALVVAVVVAAAVAAAVGGNRASLAVAELCAVLLEDVRSCAVPMRQCLPDPPVAAADAHWCAQ
jgi:hypothetical protein